MKVLIDFHRLRNVKKQKIFIGQKFQNSTSSSPPSKMLFPLVVLLLVVLDSCWGQSPQLSFDSSGLFKITQFADIHYSNGVLSGCSDVLPSQRPCNDLNTTLLISRILDAETPHLAVFSGDNISGPRSAAEAIARYSEPAYQREIPWAMVFGNHDEEADLNREEMMSEVLKLPYALTQRGPQDVFGVGNYVVELLDTAGNNVFNIYFLDSGDYSKFNGISGYEWIRPSQIEWYLSEAKRLRDLNGGQIVPALMYFHIPIPEYTQVTDKVGDTQEGVYAANVNSGLFSAILEAGDVKATFVGHDHVNDYCGVHHGIALCYGGGIGYGTYGKAGWDRRGRVVELRNNGKTVVTWKRLDNEALTLIDEQVIYQA